MSSVVHAKLLFRVNVAVALGRMFLLKANNLKYNQLHGI